MFVRHATANVVWKVCEGTAVSELESFQRGEIADAARKGPKSNTVSASILAEISARSPRKLFIFII